MLTVHSRSPDRAVRCFYTCEIILSHLLVPARGEDKKQLHAGRDVIEIINNFTMSHLNVFTILG